jgi:hypothetical protein
MELDRPSLMQAWQVRLARKGLIEGEPDVVWTGLAPQMWEQISRESDRTAPDSVVARYQGMDTVMVAGGEPVGHIQSLLSRQGTRVRGGSRVVVIQPRNDADQVATPANQIAALANRAEDLRAIQRAAAARVASLRQQVAVDNLPDAQRRAVENAYRDAMNELQSINRELSEVNLNLARLRGGR